MCMSLSDPRQDGMVLRHRGRRREEKPNDLPEVTVQKSQRPDVNLSQSCCSHLPDHAVSHSSSKEATSLTLEGHQGPSSMSSRTPGFPQRASCPLSAPRSPDHVAPWPFSFSCMPMAPPTRRIMRDKGKNPRPQSH